MSDEEAAHDPHEVQDLRGLFRQVTRPLVESIDSRLREQIDKRVDERVAQKVEEILADRLAVLERAVADLSRRVGNG